MPRLRPSAGASNSCLSTSINSCCPAPSSMLCPIGSIMKWISPTSTPVTATVSKGHCGAVQSYAYHELSVEARAYVYTENV